MAVAEAELNDAVVWYNAQVAGLGDTFLIETLKVFRLIEQHPDAWQPLAPSIRRCRLARFPYGAIYTRDSADILILALAHLHRAPTYWRDRA
ncbi:MAG: hypothetical protein JNK21_15665 [Rhodospirillaceae bacterium]|nr:hypothetical protein [Rhodospirillaceae bacterium]